MQIIRVLAISNGDGQTVAPKFVAGGVGEEVQTCGIFRYGFPVKRQQSSAPVSDNWIDC